MDDDAAGSVTPEEAFQAAVAKWSERLFTDTPQGRSLFAHGAGFVLQRLRDDPTEESWEELRDELVEFSEAYRAESDRRMNHPRMMKIREAIASGEWPDELLGDLFREPT